MFFLCLQPCLGFSYQPHSRSAPYAAVSVMSSPPILSADPKYKSCQSEEWIVLLLTVFFSPLHQHLVDFSFSQAPLPLLLQRPQKCTRVPCPLCPRRSCSLPAALLTLTWVTCLWGWSSLSPATLVSHCSPPSAFTVFSSLLLASFLSVCSHLWLRAL